MSFIQFINCGYGKQTKQRGIEKIDQLEDSLNELI